MLARSLIQRHKIPAAIHDGRLVVNSGYGTANREREDMGAEGTLRLGNQIRWIYRYRLDSGHGLLTTRSR